ncbi:hypothetical protein BU15DRAFT_63591 [Melanogaster broomeanus]|nr:hypothetical protein BU15DRAFT_63591 [Melanogaster broomeanus]
MLIEIRDYGFDASDPRFVGEGPHVPRTNRPKVLVKRLMLHKFSSSASSSPTEGEDESQWEDELEGGANGWSGCLEGWGFGVRRSVSNTAAGIPSRGDLDRNLDKPDEGGEDEDEREREMYDDGEELSDELYEDEDANPEGELLLCLAFIALCTLLNPGHRRDAKVGRGSDEPVQLDGDEGSCIRRKIVLGPSRELEVGKM